MTLVITEQMSMDLQAGEIIFYVDLPQHGDPAPVVDQLKTLGYEPKPQNYTWYRDGDQAQPVHETCALLHRAIAADPEAVLAALQVQWQGLVDVFGEQSVALVMGSDD